MVRNLYIAYVSLTAAALLAGVIALRPSSTAKLTPKTRPWRPASVASWAIKWIARAPR